MNQEHIYVPLAIVGGALLLGILLYATVRPAPSTQQTTPTEETATTTTETATPTIPKAPATSGGTARPSTARDDMTVSTVSGVVPFSTSFTLTLNTSRACTPPAYTLDFGDTGSTDISIPPNQCGKIYVVTEHHQYTRAGTFVVVLRTKPVAEASVPITKTTVTVKEQGITTGTTKYGTFTTTPTAGSVPLAVSFLLSVGDNTGNADTRYEIDYRDGTTAIFPKTTDPVLTHTYTVAGSYSVSVFRKSDCSTGTCTTSTPIGTIVVTTN